MTGKANSIQNLTKTFPGEGHLSSDGGESFHSQREKRYCGASAWRLFRVLNIFLALGVFSFLS